MAGDAISQTSPFFQTPPTTEIGALAILHLRRDDLLPITLRADADDGYAEGAVTNTRFGSFPHSTLLGLEWGSQVRASKVDTGTRGRKPIAVEHGETTGERKNNKRKSNETQPTLPESPTKKLKSNRQEQTNGARSVKAAIDAGSGFVHVLQPTPEAWTSSLDHRTQVVYTPDYSYILQRLRVKPGSTIIEAGAGSGSFTHAAARAVFNGHSTSGSPEGTKSGQVYSFEYHKPRVETLRQELKSHGLSDMVHLTHRDVCNDGFYLEDPTVQPAADAIFLDLPAPWLALKHLTRSSTPLPLNPNGPVHLCTFSPCIEQVIATVSALRKTGWTEIDMVEVQNKRIDVRREQVGLKNEGLRGVNASAATVEEALGRLREVESKLLDFQSSKNAAEGERPKIQSKAERLEKIKMEAEGRKLYKEGNLVHRTEPEVRTHTSYLVFATLPREWSDEDEKGMSDMWPVDEVMKVPLAKADKDTEGVSLIKNT